MRASITGIFAKKIEGDLAEIDIHGEIGWEVWFDRMRWLIESLDSDVKTVTFNIYSLGGDVWDGNAIVNLIGGMKQKTVANVQIAASMATAIALACDEVIMAKNGRWLVHNPWTLAMGNASELEKSAVDLRNYEKQFAEFYHDRCANGEKSLQDFVGLMDEERWMTADEALEWGFIDKVEDVFSISSYSALNKMMAKATKPLPEDFLTQNEDEIMAKNTKETPAVAGTNEDASAVADEVSDVDEVAEETVETEEVTDETADVEELEAEETDDETTEEENLEGTSALKASIKSALMADFADQIQGFKNDISERDTKIEAMKAEAETLSTENSKLATDFKTLNARLAKFTKTGLSSAGEVTTWNEALKSCNDDYASARVKYPDIYRDFMDKNK